MPKGNRGEAWMADLGMIAKVRPVLILSVNYQAGERPVATYVIRTTNLPGTQYEVPHLQRSMPPALSTPKASARILDVKSSDDSAPSRAGRAALSTIASCSSLF